MTHNHIIKLIAQALLMTTEDITKFYQLSDEGITADDVLGILKDEEDEHFVLCSDEGLELFLNGFITHKRGPSDKKTPSLYPLTNNSVLKKLRIALNFQDEEMLDIFEAGGLKLSRSELTPFFRKEDHKHYKRVSDRILKNFLAGLEKGGYR